MALRLKALAHMLDLETAAAAWWNDMGPKEKDAYLRSHPHSKYGRGITDTGPRQDRTHHQSEIKRLQGQRASKTRDASIRGHEDALRDDKRRGGRNAARKVRREIKRGANEHTRLAGQAKKLADRHSKTAFSYHGSNDKAAYYHGQAAAHYGEAAEHFANGDFKSGHNSVKRAQTHASRADTHAAKTKAKA